MNSKSIYIIIGIVVIGAILYFVMSSGSETPTNGTLSVDVVNAADVSVGNDVLILLGQINSLKIDKDFFTNPDHPSYAAYKSLVDYTVPIPAQNIGRQNPSLHLVPWPQPRKPLQVR
mgnify:CR=1 FL=1